MAAEYELKKYQKLTDFDYTKIHALEFVCRTCRFPTESAVVL